MAGSRAWLFEGDALIRAYLHIDPDTLADEEWEVQVGMAAWIERRHFEHLAKLFGA